MFCSVMLCYVMLCFVCMYGHPPCPRTPRHAVCTGIYLYIYTYIEKHWITLHNITQQCTTLQDITKYIYIYICIYIYIIYIYMYISKSVYLNRGAVWATPSALEHRKTTAIAPGTKMLWSWWFWMGKTRKEYGNPWKSMGNIWEKMETLWEDRKFERKLIPKFRFQWEYDGNVMGTMIFYGINMVIEMLPSVERKDRLWNSSLYSILAMGSQGATSSFPTTWFIYWDVTSWPHGHYCIWTTL